MGSSSNANLVQLQEFQSEVVMLLNSNFNLSGTVSYLLVKTDEYYVFFNPNSQLLFN